MDDRPLIRVGFVRLLEGTESTIIGEAASIADVRNCLTHDKPDLLFGEIELSRTPIIDLIPEFRQTVPRLGVLFYSASDNPCDEARAFSKGANGYLYRTTPRAAVLAAVRSVASGQSLWTGADQRRLSSYLRDGRHAMGSFAPLTPRERQILKLLTTGATNREISAALFISHETVKEHVQHVLKKIGVSDRTQAAVWAVRNGYA